jgi:tetratricopeptide (TPR) repeat protein
MRHAAAITGVVLSLTMVRSGAEGRPQDPTVLALQDWVTSVNTHTPGRADAAVATVSAFSFETRKALSATMGLFLSALMEKVTGRVGTDNDVQKRVVEIGRAASRNPGAGAFLKRAAVLHSDAAAYGDLHPVLAAGSAEVSRPGIKELKIDPHTGMPTNVHRDAPESPLLTNNRIVVDKDGQILGEVAGSWNWPFARSLLDLLSPTRGAAGTSGAGSVAEALVRSQPDRRSPRPAADPFVGAWYHATTAYMFANGLYGEATTHLKHAADELPDDPRILFDRACYAEILGLPMRQVLLSDADIAELLARRAGSRPSRLTAGGAAQLGIPIAEVTNAEAERLFRRALQVDPSFVEARVRLARLLDLRRRHEEAAAELNTALAAKPTGFVAFYAHLFAGRAAQALGRIDDAARHYQEAAALFPDAQSALLASSQAALLGSDVASALAPVQRLSPRSAAFDADPWWQYHLGAGRDADALLSEIWAQIH